MTTFEELNVIETIYVVQLVEQTATNLSAGFNFQLSHAKRHEKWYF